MSENLDFIRKIEDQALEIERRYSEAIEQSRQSIAVLIEEKEIDFEKNNNEKLAALKTKLEAEKRQTQTQLNETIEQSRKKSEIILSQEKEETVDWIIERVVNIYGN